MPNFVRPITTGVDLWLKYLAVTALFDVNVLTRLFNAAVELERCLQKTQGGLRVDIDGVSRI
ncbi:hypothetical protein JCM10296v2_006337 [Rhodotorula toruloides]